MKNILEKLVNFCGFEDLSRGFLLARKRLEALIERDTYGAIMLSDLLEYDSVDKENGIFFNSPGSSVASGAGCTAGFWFEISPLVGSEAGLEKNLKLFLNDELPDGGYLQFLIIASHEVGEVLDMWEAGRKHGGREIEKLTRYRRHFIENLAYDFENSAVEGRLVRNFRTFVSYSSKFGKDSVDIKIFQKKLEMKLKAESLMPRRCGAEDLMKICRELLQMELIQPGVIRSKKRSGLKYRSCERLAYQVIDRLKLNKIEVDRINRRGVNSGDLVTKIFTPADMPESFSLCEMVKLLGSENRTIPGRFVISYIVANSLGKAGETRINNAGSRVIHAAGKSYSRDDLLVQDEAREWLEVKALNKGGERYLEEAMFVSLTAREGEIEIASETLKSIYNSYDWKLEEGSFIQRPLELSMLPMMQSSYWNILKFFRCTRIALSGEVVAKLPLQGEWKGVPVSGALMIGRRGQLFCWDPFYRIGGGGNYNAVVMAPPGSGKSFLLEEVAQSMVAKGVSVFVIDIGASYQNICDQLSGEMIRFNKDCDISLNPFASLSNSGAVYQKAMELVCRGDSDESIEDLTGLSLERIDALRVSYESGSDEKKERDAIEILEIEAIDVDDGRVNGARKGAKKHFVSKDSMIYAKSIISAMCSVVGDTRAEAIIEKALHRAIGIYGEKLDITKFAHVLESLRDRKGELIKKARELADSIYPYTNDGVHGRFFGARALENGSNSGEGGQVTFKSVFTVFELEELQNDKPLLGVVLQIILMQITMQFLCGDRSRRFMLIVDEAWMILAIAANFLERFARTLRKYGDRKSVV